MYLISAENGNDWLVCIVGAPTIEEVGAFLVSTSSVV